MDLEVTRAYRILQRAGITVVSPQMDLKELEMNYAELLRAWIEHHGIHCGLLSMTNVRYGTYGQITENTLLKAAVPYLENLFEEKKKSAPASLRVRTLSHLGNQHIARIDPQNPLGSVLKGFLAHYSPKHLWSEFFEDVGIAAPGELSPAQPNRSLKDGEMVALLLCVDAAELKDGRATVRGMVCGYRDEAPEEAANTKARKEKAAQAAAQRKAAVEAKEKRLLEKLKAKYEEA